ncbi:MAG: serine/threonine protein kinase [Alphaproteobacteria bacterium]|nr:serine/threonine protein kinase [Alphaproteobacteria bacterium]
MPLRVIGQIGRGGFGIVERVRDGGGLEFARKTFNIGNPAALTRDLAENVKRRFVREAQVQRALRHPNVVPVIDADLDADPPWFLMPLAEASLQMDIDFDRSLGGDALTPIMDIISGLEELHEQGYFHRDLKPANVLRFTDQNGGSAARRYYAIGDFGFVCLRDTQVSTLTQTGMRLGSDFYTAPEIVADLRAASPQSDIYSLGCILHDLFGQEQRVPCGEIREAGDYGGIFLNCTRRDPARRFRSVAAVRDAILATQHTAVANVSARARPLVDILKQAEPLTSGQWDEITDAVENDPHSDSARGIFHQLTIGRIDELCTGHAVAARRIAIAYASWIKESAFNFGDCDGLANRLERFMQVDDLEVKAECLLALLDMGTSHNRWYVEQMFTRLANGSMDDRLARRLAVEFRTDEQRACRAIAHLEGSISFDRKDLHPILVATLAEICE